MPLNAPDPPFWSAIPVRWVTVLRAPNGQSVALSGGYRYTCCHGSGGALMRRTPASGARFSVQLCALTAPGGLPRRLLRPEEFESFADELCVVLEDAAVAGVGIGHQFTVGQAAGQVG